MKSKSVLKDKYLVAILGCVALAVVALTMMSMPSSPKGEKDLKAQYLEGGDFQLISADGPISLARFKGRPLVLYFGFTFCPDICPLGLTVIRDALNADPALSEIPAVFVSVDPARDTPERLKEYLDFFHPNMYGATGSLEAVTELSKRYGTFFMKGKEDEHGNYAVDHTAYFYVLDERGELIRVLDHNTTPEDLASAIKKLI